MIRSWRESAGRRRARASDVRSPPAGHVAVRGARDRQQRPLFVNYRGERLSGRTCIAWSNGMFRPAARATASALTRCDTRSPRTYGARTLRAIQELLGHVRLSTTQRYTHVNVAQLAEVQEGASEGREESVTSG